jgi:tetratricopeptide (TPR) repeat protein
MQGGLGVSVTHLTRLLDTGEYQQCLQEAAAMLTAGGHSEEDGARIYAAICRSCLELTDYRAAEQAGRQAEALARRAGASDVLGFVLVDLATAQAQLRRYNEALDTFKRYQAGLDTYVAACCLEGAALQRMAEAYRKAGRPAEAIACFQRARRWFDRFGDQASAQEAVRAMVHLYLEQNEPAQALPLLQELRRAIIDGEAQCRYLLDWTRYYLVTREYDQAAAIGFLALECADDRLAQQSQAHLLLCRAALAQSKPEEALCFAMGARVAAIDGRLYDLEFEASEVIFGLLRSYGADLLNAVEADFARQGVSLYQYLSEDVVRRHV